MPPLTEERLRAILSEHLAPLATKQDVRDAVEELARLVSGGFDDTRQRMDVIARLNHLEIRFEKVEEALHLKI